MTRDTQPVASYAYDANGNRSGGTYDDQDRLLTLGGTTYTYTKNGELATKSDAAGVTEYKYDPFGNLQTALLPDGKRIDYVLDAQSRRVGKKVNGTLVTGWLYADQNRIVAETDGTGTVTKRFVYATRANAPDYMLFNGVTYRFVADHLGSPRYILEASAGTVVESLQYDEFGNVLSDSNPGYQPFGFAGGLYDSDTGLVHFGAREFDPVTARWTAKDPIGFAGRDTNVYEYVSADPVNFVDPPGLWAFGVAGAETTEAGTNAYGAGQQGGAGFGFFGPTFRRIFKGDWQHSTSTGAFTSWGRLAYGGDRGRGWPSCDGVILGAYAGVGGNVWLSNAQNVTDLEGPFRTLTVNAAWGVKGFSAQYQWGENSAGQTIGVFSFGLPGTGAGAGASISFYDTFTQTFGPWGTN